MSRNSSLILLALILGAMIFPAASIYAWQRSQQSHEDMSAKIALDHLYNSSTFSFDGIANSVKVVGVTQTLTYVTTRFTIVTIEFDCSNGGYGDRTGQNVIQMIKHHTAVIHIADDLVTMMVLDGIWDELAGQMI